MNLSNGFLIPFYLRLIISQYHRFEIYDLLLIVSFPLGAACSHEDHCASQPCRNGGKCVADNTTTAGYSCACPPGFTGSRCTEDVVECSSGPGPCHHGRCFNTHGSYTCVCEPGYTGRDCDAEYVPCEPSPCLHDGKCTPLDQLRYKCDCPTGK